MERIFERDFHVIAQIGAAPWRRPTAATKGAAKNGFENVAQIAEFRATAETATACTRTALLERGMAIPVIGGAFLRI